MENLNPNLNLRRYLEIKKQIALLEKEANLIKREIRTNLPFGTHEFGDIKVIRSTRIRIDLDKESVLLKLGAEAYQACEKASEYEVVEVKQII